MDRKTFAILMILFNQVGIPSFIQGQTKTGIIRIVLCIIPVVGCIFAVINFVKGLLLGLEILKMTDEEYEAKKGTFDTGIPAAPAAE